MSLKHRNMKQKIVFIVNHISGTTSKEGIPALINRYIDRDKYDFEIRMTEYAGHAEAIARESMEQGAHIVVAVGGDGTINEVARAIVHSETALGIIPCGSGNGLARHLMLPMKVQKAIDIINRGEIHTLDYGIINDHPFFCTCGMGFDADVSMRFAESGKRGPITYVQKVLEQGLKYKPETYEIIDSNGVSRCKAFLISCANASQYGNNAYIAPQASMSDGLLDVVIMEPFTMLEAPQISIDMFNKTLDKSSKIKTFKCKELNIRRKKPGVIHYDGDPMMSGEEVHIQLEEKGIRVVVNPDADKAVRKPNALQTAAAELFNEINFVRDDLSHRQRQVRALSKVLQRKLNL